MTLALVRKNYPLSAMRRSLRVWLVLGAPLATLVACTVFWLSFLSWEYLHNPSRHFYEVAEMAPSMSIVTFVIASIAQIITYIVLPFYARALLRWCGHASLALLVAATPLLGLSVWFGYEHFVPDWHWYTDDSPRYVYGLTLWRFLYGWAFEIVIVLLYWWPLRRVHLVAADAVR